MVKSSEDWAAELAAFDAEQAEKERKAKERRKQLQSRKRDAEARERVLEKKKRDKKLILMGVVLEQMLDKHPQVRKAYEETANATLVRARDRELFGLPTKAEPPAPKKAATATAAKRAKAPVAAEATGKS